MSGPWSAPPPPPPPPEPRRRSAIGFRLALVVALGVLVFGLARAFPERLRGPQDWGDAGYLCGALLLLAAGASRLTRDSLRRSLRYGAIWLGIVAVLAVGFAYRSELAGVGQRVRVAFGGGTVATGTRELSIGADAAGHFQLVGRVNGERVAFMVDTGATDTVLDPDDARRIGIDVDALTYDSPASTANGTGYSARAAADLEVGEIRVRDFPLRVNQTPIGVSLLGVSFLKRLRSYEVRGDTLVMRW
jgi:aspartyl protease family protein